MGPEELGSVYESLLELVPQITKDGAAFAFATGGRDEGQRAQDHAAATTRPTASCRCCSTARSSRSCRAPSRRTRTSRARRCSSSPIVDPGVRLRPLPARGRAPARGARRAAPGERHAVGRRVPPRAAAGGRPLHLRRRPEPDGRRAVQGEPLDGGRRARAAAHVPRLAHPARQRPARHDAGADGERHPRRGVGADRGRRQEDRERAEEAEQGGGRRASAGSARCGRSRATTKRRAVARAVAELEAASDAESRRSRRRSRSGAASSSRTRTGTSASSPTPGARRSSGRSSLGPLADAAPTNELWRQIRDGQGDAAAADVKTTNDLRDAVSTSSTGTWSSRRSSRGAGSTSCWAIRRGSA